LLGRDPWKKGQASSARRALRGRGRGLPAHFRDLHLDELQAAPLAPHGGMGLEAIFRRPLQDGKAVVHRQRVAQDLEAEPLAQAFRTFFRGTESMRKPKEPAPHVRRSTRLWTEAKGLARGAFSC
jgi:hypothetical protein